MEQQNTRNETRHKVQLAMEETAVQRMRNDLGQLRDPRGAPDTPRAGEPGRQTREVDVVQASLQAVITAKERLGGYDQEIKTLQEAIDLWNSRR